MTRPVLLIFTRYLSFNRCRAGRLTACALLALALAVDSAWAAGDASVRGTVADPLGAGVPRARLTLLRDGQRVAETSSDDSGGFAFDGIDEGRYRIDVVAEGFEPRGLDLSVLGGSARVVVDVALQIGFLTQYVSVTATATETPLSQTGAPVAVIDSATLTALLKPDVLDVLKLVPGVQVAQTGQRGGPTSVFVRGGNSNFTKVLVDGVAANDIGGAFDFGGLALSGVHAIEVLRQSNSVLFGSDALTGVISVTTRRGRTRVPEASYAIDGGTFGSMASSLSVGGTARQLDYFSEYSLFDTDNGTPNSHHRNGTYAGRFSAALGHATDLSGTIRRIGTRSGSPNFIDFYGIADDSSQEATATLVSVVAKSQMTDRWQGAIRLGLSDQTSRYLNPSPTGEPFDPFGFGTNYLGKTVTIRGANGYAATGQAILDYGGTYPSQFKTRTRRLALSAQTDIHVLRDLDLSVGGRFDREAAFDDAEADASATRDNRGVFVEARGTLGRRAYASAGLGYEHNAAFKAAVTPRASAAFYLRGPAKIAPFGDTKVVVNAGAGVKSPSVFQEQGSLFMLLASVPGAPDVSPIGPERSRNVDVGVEQGLLGGRARVRASYFNNNFSDLIEYVSKGSLPQVGVPPAVAAGTAFGAYVNSQSFRARGLETSADVAIGGGVRINASYTYLDAVVTESFASGALTPAANPAYPDVPIGAYSPLVGQRPFRRAPHSGHVLVSYARGAAQLSLSGSFVGRRDDSTFLTDGFFGNALLLPNRDLDPGYQTVDLGASYAVHRRLRAYASLANLLDQPYRATSGAPSLSRTIRVGARIVIGGDR